MGFHKRRITYDSLRTTYKEGGVKGLKTLLSADALFAPPELDLGTLYEMLDNDDSKKIEKWLKELPN